MGDKNIKRLTWQWKMAYNDSKKFQHTNFSMSQKEIEFEITKIDKNATSGYLIVPTDINATISPLNSTVVSVVQRKALMKLVKKRDTLEYTRMVTDIQTENVLKISQL